MPPSTRLTCIFVLILGFTIHGMNPTVAAEARDTVSIDTRPARLTTAGSTFVFEPFYKQNDGASKEFAAARGDHAAIALQVSQCYPDISDPLQWPPAVRAMLLFELNENLMHVVPADDSKATIHPPPLNPFHTAAIAYSDRLSRDRLEFRRDLEDSLARGWRYQWLVIGLGAAATIAVSLRAVWQNSGHLSQGLSVAAIVLSSLGTAASSMSNSDHSAATAFRDQRALAQLQQLHWRIAADLMHRPELCGRVQTPLHAAVVHKETTDKVMADALEVVNAWRARHEAILDNAMESIAKPGDLSGGRSPDDSQTKISSPSGAPGPTALGPIPSR